MPGSIPGSPTITRKALIYMINLEKLMVWSATLDASAPAELGDDLLAVQPFQNNPGSRSLS